MFTFLPTHAQCPMLISAMSYKYSILGILLYTSKIATYFVQDFHPLKTACKIFSFATPLRRAIGTAESSRVFDFFEKCFSLDLAYTC
jgi:hypothetical protein